MQTYGSTFQEGMFQAKAILFKYSLDPGIPSNCRRNVFCLKVEIETEEKTEHKQTRHVADWRSELSEAFPHLQRLGQ